MSFTQSDIDRFIEHASEHQPWVDNPEVWKTEAAYWTWLRGGLRKLWTRWIPRNKLKMSSRKKVTVTDSDGNPLRFKTGKRAGEVKTRYEVKCEVCEGMFPQAQVEADHIDPSGSCSNSVEAGTFLFRLLVSADKLRLVCKPCHKIITYAERQGISFDEAREKKKVIELMKKKVGAQKKELLRYGFIDIGNKTSREACYAELVEKGKL